MEGQVTTAFHISALTVCPRLPDFMSELAYRLQIGKIDVETGECWAWRGTPDTVSTEAVFVGRPGAQDEDDGVLLFSTVSSHPDERDAFVVLDAKTMVEIARAEIDVHLGGSLHATFLPNKF